MVEESVTEALNRARQKALDWTPADPDAGDSWRSAIIAVIGFYEQEVLRLVPTPLGGLTEEQRWTEFCSAVRRYWHYVPAAVALDNRTLFNPVCSSKNVWELIRAKPNLTAEELSIIVRSTA